MIFHQRTIISNGGIKTNKWFQFQMDRCSELLCFARGFVFKLKLKWFFKLNAKAAEVFTILQEGFWYRLHKIITSYNILLYLKQCNIFCSIYDWGEAETLGDVNKCE